MSIKDSNAKLEEDLTDLNSLYDDAVVALAKLEQRNTELVAALRYEARIHPEDFMHGDFRQVALARAESAGLAEMHVVDRADLARVTAEQRNFYGDTVALRTENAELRAEIARLYAQVMPAPTLEAAQVELLRQRDEAWAEATALRAQIKNLKSGWEYQRNRAEQAEQLNTELVAALRELYEAYGSIEGSPSKEEAEMLQRVTTTLGHTESAKGGAK